MIKRIIGTVAGALAILLWFLANQFRKDALVPRPPQHEFGTWVTAISDTTITLTATEPHRFIHHPGTLGLHWDGGYGELGEIVSSGDLWVERAFSTDSVTGPQVCPSESFDNCEPVDVEGWAYENDPGDVGLDFSDISFDSPLGPLGAWVIPAETGSVWAIHVHGWSAARREAVRMLGAHHRQNITSMVIDYRNDPGAPKDPSGHYRFGLSEWEDLDAAATYAIESGAEGFVLAGYSTGAAAVMAFMERSRLADRVVALVLDAPNIDMNQTVAAATRDMSLPAPLMAGAKVISDLRWQIGWDQINYVKRASDLAIPILVFHGGNDDRVPLQVSRDLREANPTFVTLHETPEAGHVMSWNVDPDLYNTRLEEFLKRETGS